MSSSTWGMALAGVMISAVACGPAVTAGFDSYGYKHESYGYRLLQQQGGLLPGDWRLDNLYQGKRRLEPKQTPEYVTQFGFDLDGDGAVDWHKQEFVYDLRFKHVKRDAAIWLRTLPISSDLREKDLRVLLQRYVDEVSGAGFEAVQLGPNTTIVREKRFAATVLERGAFTLARQQAFMTTFDVANVDEVAINPGARRTRVRIVLVRTPFNYRVSKQQKQTFPVLMLAGYANLPEDFAKDEPAFTSFLGRIQIGKEVGVTPLQPEQLATGPNPSSAPPPAAGAPAAPTTPNPNSVPAQPAAPLPNSASAPAPSASAVAPATPSGAPAAP